MMPKRLLPYLKLGLLVLAIAAVSVGTTLAVLHFRAGTGDKGKTEQQQVVAEVGKLMLLPSGEDPTLATVTDVTKLKDQPFFAHAQNGDKMLIYAKAQQTILYRPGINKIINVGPVISGNGPSPYVTSQIAILDGSGQDGALDKMTRQVVSTFPNSTIVEKQAAPRLFPNTIAIDLTKKNQPLDEQIADSLSIKTGQLPLGINASADILIIIGQDYK